MESEALFWILELAKQGTVILINSSLVEHENSLNPFPERKMFIEEVMRYAKIYQNVDEQIKKRATRLHGAYNISSIDALHVAAAEKAKADFFITCDHALIKKYKGNLIAIVTPLEFISRYADKNN